MSKKINQGFEIRFTMNNFDALSGLIQRRLMTPSHFSTFIMSMILPATSLIEKRKPLKNDKDGFCTNSLIERDYRSSSFFSEEFLKIATTHRFTSVEVEGLETLEAKRIHENQHQKYEILFSINDDDGVSFSNYSERILADESKNYIFWNYPGVGCSVGKVISSHDLFKAGYKQAKRLIAQGIPAENITLNGHSLGGGVASHVARQLHEEGHFVNLTVDRSFSRISLVMPEKIKEVLLAENTFKQTGYAPLITSVISCALSAATLGTAFAGLLATLNLIVNGSIAAMGYVSGICIQSIGFSIQKILHIIGEIIAFPFSFFSKSISKHIKSIFDQIGYLLSYPFNLTGFVINKIFSTIAALIDSLNILSTIVGGVIVCAGLVVGSLVGLALGGLLSIQRLWTEKPILLSMGLAFSLLLNSLCCEMNSVNEIHRLVNVDNNLKNKSQKYSVDVINVTNDHILKGEASLYKGLINSKLKDKINFFWKRGSHTGHMRNIEPEVSSLPNSPA